MKLCQTPRENHGLTLIEVLILVIILAVIAILTLPAIQASRRRNLDLQCRKNLEEIGRAFTDWAREHDGKFPMQVSSTNGGAMEFAVSGNAAASIKPVFTRLSSPKILICPGDKIRRATTSFTNDFDNSNVSYFIGLDADTNNPNTFLSGDGDLTLQGIPVKSGLLTLSSNAYHELGLDERLHWGGGGNLVFADGSVHGTYDGVLQWKFLETTLATNHLAIP